MVRGVKNTRKTKRLTGRSHAKLAEPALVLPTIDDLTCPSNLKGEAARRWAALAPVLRDADLLTAVSLAAFILHCRAWGDLLEAQQHLDREGKIVPGAHGRAAVRNPWCVVEKGAAETFFKTGRMFGLTPDAVGKVKATPKDEPTLEEQLRAMVPAASMAVSNDETPK